MRDLTAYQKVRLSSFVDEALISAFSLHAGSHSRAEEAFTELRSKIGLGRVPCVWTQGPREAAGVIYEMMLKRDTGRQRKVVRHPTNWRTIGTHDLPEIAFLKPLHFFVEYEQPRPPQDHVPSGEGGIGGANELGCCKATAVIQGEKYLRLKLPQPDIFAAWNQANLNCGYWWNFEKVVIACERPTTLHMDTDPITWARETAAIDPITRARDGRAWARDGHGRAPRLHSTTGPTCAYPDGYEIYALHGIKVDKRFITDTDSVLPHEIDRISNVEVRRVVMDLYGYEKYLRRSGAQIIHENPEKKRKLWWRMPVDEVIQNAFSWRAPPGLTPDLTRGQPVVMVEVENSTPEPDGSFKRYFLRVPPTMRDADSAIAWTFRMSKEEYQLAVET